MTDPVPKILLVDDEPRNLRILEGILAPLRYDLRRASSGQQALEQVEIDPPGLVLLDVMMPGLSGFDVCRRLKEEEATRFVPVVLVTALSERESRIAGIEAGADDFISKPVDGQELRVRVKSLLRIKQLHDELQRRTADLERSNQQLAEANEQLTEANRQIQENTRRKSDFLARMSHDLRTPMNAIVGYTRILMRKAGDVLDPRQFRNLENIQTSSGNLLNLINEILDLSKVEAGRIEVRPRDVDLGRLAGECAASVAPLVSPGVELVEQFAGVPVVRTDPDILRKVLMNLLGNAVKFTARGTITLSVQPVGDQVELSVADTGVGIPAADLPFVFEEFRQVERQGSSEKEGTGLGLAIARRSVELLGGSIWAESEVGEGTTFTLRIGDCEG